VPGLVEVLLSLLLLGGGWLGWRRLRGLIATVRARAALEDYLFGVEQALHGDLAGAHERLSAVLAKDPQNHYARMLFGKVLADLGEPAEAHRQHLYLQRAFAIDSAENELYLAKSLLAAGMPAEAAAVAEAALPRLPQPQLGFAFVFRARLQAGEPAAAAAAGRRLLGGLARLPDAAALRLEVGEAIAADGLHRLAQGASAAALVACADAQRLAPESPMVRLLQARLEAARDGLPQAVQAVLQASVVAVPVAAPVAAVGAGAAPRGLVPAATAGPTGLPVATFAGLLPAARWTCRHCGAPSNAPHRQCLRCSARDSAQPIEPLLGQPLESPARCMDAIEHNRAHVQRVVQAALTVAAPPAAMLALERLGKLAWDELLRAAWQGEDGQRERALALLQQAGPEALPDLFAAARAQEAARLLAVGGLTPTAVLARLVQSHRHRALPYLQPLLASARQEDRRILIDFHLGLADFTALQAVLERFPPLEILHRLHRAETPVLVRFLQALPPGHFVGEVLLRESAFDREDAVLAAIPGAEHPQELEALLRRRGPSRALVRALLEGLREPALATVAHRLLVGFGPAMLDLLLAAFVDPDRSPADRTPLAAVLVAVGAPAVDRICANFASQASTLDDALVMVLQAMPEHAVPELLAAYEHSGWWERVSLGMVSRHTNRRMQILRSLAALPFPAARQALVRLQQRETDPNLRLRLAQYLHAAAGGTDSGGTVSGDDDGRDPAAGGRDG
jgi:hypothetical protein